MLAATIFLGGSLGFEFIEGMHVEIYSENNLTYIILTTIEECLEMIGVIVFIKALILYVNENFGELRLQFKSINANAALQHSNAYYVPKYRTSFKESV